MKLILLLFSALLIHTIYSQTGSIPQEKLIETDTITVHLELPQYVVQVYNLDDDLFNQRIKIYAIGDSNIIQTFDLVEVCCLDMYEDLIDINFDGYKDLKVSGFWNNWHTGATSFWLFNSELKIFEKSEEFSDFGDIEISEENQTISNWGGTAGYNKYSWSEIYKVVNNHLVIIEEQHSYKYDKERKVLQGDTLVTVSKSYVEEKYDSAGKQIDGNLVHNLWIIRDEDLIYGKLRPVKEVYQWLYEGDNPENIGERLVQEDWNMENTFILEKEIWYEYSVDEFNNIYVQETIGDYINGKWESQKMLPKLLNE
uniref:Uncharacterized protein n=1 Tax=Ignavibacterium album TaxID=591197 RepID=A0A832DL16_9BACT